MIKKLILLALIISVSFAQNTYVLIHGAGTGAYSWFKVKSRLEKAGHTVIAFDLPGLGIDKTDREIITFEHHVNRTLEVLDSLSEPAIVVGHSYGGALVSAVSELRPQKVKKAVYLTAFMLQDGESVATANDRNVDTLASLGVIYGAEAPSIPDFLRTALCSDCSEEDLSLLSLSVQIHPKDTLFTPINIGDNYASVKKVYIEALQDRALTADFQEDMYSKFPGTKVYTINSSHNLLLAKPCAVVRILKKL